MESLINSTTTNDLEDIVEQTKGLVGMIARDPSLKTKFQPIVEKNIQEILARQHTDGGWVTADLNPAGAPATTAEVGNEVCALLSARAVSA